MREPNDLPIKSVIAKTLRGFDTVLSVNGETIAIAHSPFDEENPPWP